MLLALALALQTAAAEPPCVAVRLPAGATAEDWEAPLELAGLCQVSDGQPASVTVVDEGGWCEIEASGTQRQAAITCPRTPAEREDLAWLAASLARNPPALRFAPPPPPPPVVAAPPPRPPPRAPSRPAAPTPPPVLEALVVPEPAPEPAPPPPAVAEAPPVVATPPVTPVAPEVAPPIELPVELERARPYAEAGITAEVRPGAGPSLGVAVAAGVAGPRTRFALALGANAPHALTVAGEERRHASTDLLGTAAWRRGVALAGVGVGASLRRYWDDRTSVSGVVPVARLEVRATALAAGAFRIEPALRAQIDLRPTTLAVNGELVDDLSPWGAQLLVAVVYPP